MMNVQAGMNWLRQKLVNLIKIGTIKSVDDSGNFRFGTSSFLGKTQKLNIFGPYGVLYNPPVGSLALQFAVQCEESKMMSICDDPKNRPLKLEPGEVALANYLTGDYIYFNKNGELAIKSSNGLSMDVDGDISINATGKVSISSESFDHNDTNIGDDHAHSDVQTGGSNTGGPV